MFDREASAKLTLHYLATHKGATSRVELGRDLSLTEDQCGEVIAYLVDAGMVEQLESDKVKLSGFGDDALGVFAVS